MTWKVEWDDRARRELRRLDTTHQKRILRFTNERLSGPENPRRFGKPLRGAKAGIWRYRIGSYRLLCQIEDQQVVILVLRLGSRADIYR